MELKDFISNTLLEIHRGVEEAKKETKNDYYGTTSVAPNRVHQDGGAKMTLSSIDFDLSVTTSDESTTDKRAGLIKIVDAGINKGKSSSQETTNRIRFSIPFHPRVIGEND